MNAAFLDSGRSYSAVNWIRRVIGAVSIPTSKSVARSCNIVSKMATIEMSPYGNTNRRWSAQISSAHRLAARKVGYSLNIFFGAKSDK